MSNYPVWWDTSLTVYNKYEDPQTQIVTWFRTTLENCFWKASGSKVTVNDVTLDTEGVICRIPKNPLFLEKYEWVDLPNDEMSEYFTLAPSDIIVRGIVTDEIDEYTKGKRSSDLMNKYKDLRGCIQIDDVALNVGVGRNNEHYYVRGK